jgi:inhibitor of KinA sporulation pathway (predicted exonuclease)
MPPKQILIVDLEATCWDDRPQTVEMMEVIEFGLAVASVYGALVDSASVLVRPQLSPRLSPFCEGLTGITQAMVESAPEYAQALTLVDRWCGQYSCDAWGSWGEYDRRQLEAEAARHRHQPQFMSTPHVNLKKLWRKAARCKRQALRAALEHHGLSFEGRHHRGVDDARNIARLVPFIPLPDVL